METLPPLRLSGCKAVFAIQTVEAGKLLMFWPSKSDAPVVAMAAVQNDTPQLVVVREGDALGLVIKAESFGNQPGIVVDDILEIAVVLSEPSQDNDNAVLIPGGVYVLDGVQEDERGFALGVTSDGRSLSGFLKLSVPGAGQIVGRTGGRKLVGVLSLVERRAKVI